VIIDQEQVIFPPTWKTINCRKKITVWKHKGSQIVAPHIATLASKWRSVVTL